MKPLVVVGSINLDLVAHCDRIPGAGETITGNSFATHHGGKGANQAVAAARLGASVSMIGCLGDDRFGQELRAGLDDSQVDTSAVQTVPGSSGIALIQVDARGENRITVIPAANAELSAALLARHEARIAAAGMVLTQLETPLPTVEALAGMCERLGTPFMLDPAPAAALPPAALRRVRWLTPNLSEACALLHRPEPAEVSRALGFEIARELLDLGPEGILLKLGVDGLVLLEKDAAPEFQPPFRVTAVDTTAAGDACNAAFATALLRGLPRAEAMRFAAAAGALAVTQHGAQPSLPTREQVERFASEHP